MFSLLYAHNKAPKVLLSNFRGAYVSKLTTDNECRTVVGFRYSASLSGWQLWAVGSDNMDVGNGTVGRICGCTLDAVYNVKP